MSTFSKAISFLVLSLAACLPFSTQNLLSQILQPPATAPAPQKTSDRLGRETPYGTVFGFLQAAQSGDYSIAAQYLQMSPARRQGLLTPVLFLVTCVVAVISSLGAPLIR